MLLSQACQAAPQMDIPVNYRLNLPCFPAAWSTELMTCL